jgi:hypothetical protein
MKKLIIILALLLIPAFSCFAGSFYSNIVLLPFESEKVLPLLLQMGITAYYAFKNKAGVIFEKRIEKQDVDYGIKLITELSQKLQTTAIYTTVYDSDVLLMYICKNAQPIFFYNSAPGYDNNPDLPPQIEYLDKLLLEYKNINKEELVNILNSREVFAENLHYKIANLLNLPPYSVQVGYNYLKENEITEELENIHSIKFEKTGN